MIDVRSTVRRVYAEEQNARQLALMRFLSKVSKKYDAGDHIYVVGGAPRDFVIDRPIKDIDVVVDKVSLGKGSEWFAEMLQGEIPVETSYVTNQYGVAILTVNGPWAIDGHDLQGEKIEIANARKESYVGEGGQGYKPTEVEPATIEEDTKRRELTINTLLWRLADLENGPSKEDIIDLTGCGLDDIEDGVLRCPTDPDKTFSDDPTRMLRVIKYFIRYGFDIHPLVERSIQKNADKLKKAPVNAISEILIEDILAKQQSRATLRALERVGLLDVIEDLLQESEQFRTTVSNWATRDADVLFMFDLMDVGLSLSTKVDFLDRAQQSKLYDIALQLDPAATKEFVNLLKQPGKKLNTTYLIDRFGLQGPEIQRVMETARDVLLRHPELRHDSDALTSHVEGNMS